MNCSTSSTRRRHEPEQDHRMVVLLPLLAEMAIIPFVLLLYWREAMKRSPFIVCVGIICLVLSLILAYFVLKNSTPATADGDSFMMMLAGIGVVAGLYGIAEGLKKGL